MTKPRWAVLLLAAVLGTIGIGTSAARSWSGSVPGAAGPAASETITNPVLYHCGPLSCDARQSYCETIRTDVPALPSDHACRALPASCLPRSGGGLPDCDCFPRGTRGHLCSSPVRNGVRTFYRTTVGGA
jgi:hypothetical protein